MLLNSDKSAQADNCGTLGWHSAIDLHDCTTSGIDDLDWVRRTMLEAAARAGALVVGEHFHRFVPWGISGVVVIGESHLAVHIWPERRFAAIDVFTCNTRLQLRAAAEFLTCAFAAREPRIVTLPRGSCAIPRGDAESARTPVCPRNRRYVDYEDATGGHWFVRDDTLASRCTEFQKVEILEFRHFGRALLLDGALQSTERDEYIYHEALVHPALCLHADPRQVLIIGGGEGATAREVLKHPTVQRVVMVDIDRELLALARDHLSSWHRNSFLDPRLHLFIGDGHEFVARTAEKFDAIIVDLVDSFQGGPAEALYTSEFYRRLKSRLSDDGVLVIQAMECDAAVFADHRRILGELEDIFTYRRSYLSFVPSFNSTWGFILAADTIDACAKDRTIIDAVIERRGLGPQLHYYDGRTHVGLFALSKDLRHLLGVP